MKKLALLSTVALLLVSLQASAVDVDCDNIRLVTKKHMVCDRFDQKWALKVAKKYEQYVPVMLSKFGDDEVVVKEMFKNRVGAKYLNSISEELYEKYRLDVPDLNNEQVLKKVGESIVEVLSFDGKVKVQDFPATRAHRAKVQKLTNAPEIDKLRVIYKSSLDVRREDLLDTAQFSTRENGVFLKDIRPFVNKEGGRRVIAKLNGKGQIVKTGLNKQMGDAFYWKVQQPVTLIFLENSKPIRKTNLTVEAAYERRLKGFWYGVSHVFSQWNEIDMNTNLHYFKHGFKNVCEEVLERNRNNTLKEIQVGSYLENSKASFFVDFDNDGHEEELQYFPVGAKGYIALQQIVNGERKSFSSASVPSALLSYARIVQVNGQYYKLHMSNNRPYELQSVAELSEKEMRQRNFDKQIKSPIYTSETLCKYYKG